MQDNSYKTIDSDFRDAGTEGADPSQHEVSTLALLRLFAIFQAAARDLRHGGMNAKASVARIGSLSIQIGGHSVLATRAKLQRPEVLRLVVDAIKQD